jgi:Na+/H+ antiporter
MELISVILVMLLAVVASGYIVRISPIPLPAPLVQIALGAVIALATQYRAQLNPEIFFLLFIPPLLFLDGWRIPKQELKRDLGLIVELALNLVIFTVVGLGFFIHWMIPAMPLAVAFALAAVVSPTDPIAVSSITQRTPMPKRLMHILEGESLLNDASGLVCLRFAIAAAVTGTFSLVDASLTFLLVALGGLAIGVGVTLLIVWAKNLLTKKLGEESGSQILISLLIPFAAYLAAEHVHVSGILAAVSAGVTMSFTELSSQAGAATRVQRGAVWDAMQFALNGVIFVLLGEQLPAIVENASLAMREINDEDPWRLVVYALAITAGLAVLRFVWVWVSVRFVMLRARRKGRPEATPPGLRIVAAVSFAGVRGAITLAGVLTLPLTLADGSPFPARDLAILLAASVIILSLIAASVFLPLILKGIVVPDADHETEEDGARVAAAEAAILAIEQAQTDYPPDGGDPSLHADAAARIIEVYRRRIARRASPEQTAADIRRRDQIEQSLWLTALRAERAELMRLARARRLGDDAGRRLVHEIDLMESRFAR